MLAVISHLVSVKMIASLGSDDRPLAFSPSSFFQWSNRRGRKRSHTPVGKELGKFPRWRGLPFTHCTSFIPWAMGGLQCISS